MLPIIQRFSNHNVISWKNVIFRCCLLSISSFGVIVLAGFIVSGLGRGIWSLSNILFVIWLFSSVTIFVWQAAIALTSVKQNGHQELDK